MKKDVRMSDNKRIWKSNWTELKFQKVPVLTSTGHALGTFIGTKTSKKGGWCFKVFFCCFDPLKNVYAACCAVKHTWHQKKKKKKPQHHHHHHRHMWTFSWFVLINLWTVASIILSFCLHFVSFLFFESILCPFVIECWSLLVEQWTKSSGAKQTCRRLLLNRGCFELSKSSAAVQNAMGNN